MNDNLSSLALFNLLTNATTSPCLDGARAFSLLSDDRFSLAIDGLIPILQNQNIQIPQRILAAFVLDSLYNSHDQPNPFRNHLLHIYEVECSAPITSSQSKTSLGVRSPHMLASFNGNGAHTENERLVWVLWKILNGQGNDLAKYSPLTLSYTHIMELHHSSSKFHENIFSIPNSSAPSKLASADFDPFEGSHHHEQNAHNYGNHLQTLRIRQKMDNNLSPINGRFNLSQSEVALAGQDENVCGPSQTRPASLLSPSSHDSISTHSATANYTENYKGSFANDTIFNPASFPLQSDIRSRPDVKSHTRPNLSWSPSHLGSQISASYDLFPRLAPPDISLGSSGAVIPQEPAKESTASATQPFVFGPRVLGEIQWPTQKRTPLPARSPGIIGSGRPSASAARSGLTIHQNGIEQRQPHIGIIGAGRPQSSTGNGGAMPSLPDRVQKEEMIPFSVLRTRSIQEQASKQGLGVISSSGTEVGGITRISADGHGDILNELTMLSLEERVSFQNPAQPIINNNSHRSGASPQPIYDQYNAKSTSTDPQIHSHPAIKIETYEKQAVRRINSNIVPHFEKAAEVKQEAEEPSFRVSSSAHAYISLPENCAPSGQPPPERRLSPNSTTKQEKVAEEQVNKERDELSSAILLLLSARERVLTLSEQRKLRPHLPMLTQPLSLLRPSDLPSLIAMNTDLAAKLLTLLLDREDDDATRVEEILKNLSFDHEASKDDTHIASTTVTGPSTAVEAIKTAVKFVSTCGAPSLFPESIDVSPFGGREVKEGYLEVLKKLPPTKQSFNLIARLLTPTASSSQKDAQEARIAGLVKAEVLGGFLSGCVRWIEQAEQEEKEGQVHDDRVACAIANLCRFYSSLIMHGFIAHDSEVDTVEMMGFALRFSRFEEARSLYSKLVAVRV